MGEKTGILWTDHTFNPWIGCTKVSAGCANCYAERENNIYKWNPNGWGENADRVRTSENYWKQPLKWAKQAVKAGVIRRVFCASLADVFDEKVPFEWLNDLWKLIAATQEIGGLEWLILTKRPENISTRIPTEFAYPSSCVRLGVTAENQEMADKRIPILLRSWSGKNFLSVEPMLGPVELEHSYCGYLSGWETEVEADEDGDPVPYQSQTERIGWVICGGESGPNARPMHPNWAISVSDQCEAANVPFFFKQQGEWAPVREFPTFQKWVNKAQTWLSPGDICMDATGKVCRIGGDFENAAYPVTIMRKVGKKNAGSILDGKEWKQFPEVRKNE
jgi:protein gp37